MRTRWWTYLLLSSWLALAATSGPSLECQAVAADSARTKIVLIAGACEHPPGTHEAAAGARLLKHCLENVADNQKIVTGIINQWPEDPSALDNAATVVFIGDLFPPERMKEPAKVKAQLSALMDRGCGIVCIHFATGLRAQHVAQDGDHPLLEWLGGYYASGCPHHRSVARVCTATITPEKGGHPALRGWKAFTFDDEPYWNNYFGKDGPPDNVTPLASSMLPADNPQKEIVAWAVSRTDGGRGVGIVLPHYFRNWRVDDLRTFVLNSILWTARLDVPPDGVKSALPADLSIFEPASVDPKPRPKRR